MQLQVPTPTSGYLELMLFTHMHYMKSRVTHCGYPGVNIFVTLKCLPLHFVSKGSCSLGKMG